MLSNLEKFSSMSKTILESQFEAFGALAGKAVEGGEKAIALNFAAAKAHAKESSVAIQQLISTKDTQAFFELATIQAKLSADKATSYGRDLTETISSIHADFTKDAEAHVAASKIKVTAFMDEIIKNAPAGSDNMVGMLKMLICNANASCEQLTNSTKQAVEAVEAHVVKAVDQLSQVEKKAA